jgi:NAD(P)-dependent dehydrogenase (short-subunit alcohol dehydrogenase family)
MPEHRPAVLVTGCSSGIGAAVAHRLHRAGFPVYASARRIDDLADLAGAGLNTVQLDVTDEASMQAAVKRIADERQGVGVLVNNAGFGLAGVVEEVPLDTLRTQFETNVFGAVRLTQLVLPGMRARRWGRVVNISSIFGRAAPPGGGAYHATKHALEALTDALRLEVRRFGIRAVLIEPGPVRTPFAAATASNMVGDSEAYRQFRENLRGWYRAMAGPGPRNAVSRFAVTADDVAAVVERAVRSTHPRARYPVGLLAHSFLLLRRTLPDPLFDGFVRAQFPIP